jgi:hypothetical protein
LLFVDGNSIFMCQVFTWYGATIEVDGTTELDYAADEVCAFALLVFSLFLCFVFVIWFMLLPWQIKISLEKFFLTTDDSVAILDF